MAICAVDGCEPRAGSRFRRGYCQAHYKKLMKYGDPLAERRVRNICIIDGCDLLVTGHGWCCKHYTRWQRYGDALYRIPGEIRDGKRICSQCGQDKPAEMFGKNGNPALPSRVGGRTATGLKAVCNPCTASAQQARRKAGLVVPWKPADPGYWAARTRNWRVRNPDKVRAATQARRARRVGATIESFTPSEIFERDRWMCGICAWPIDQTIRYPDPLSPSLDHKIPLARGGEHSRENCQASHLRCNIKKHAKVAA